MALSLGVYVWGSYNFETYQWYLDGVAIPGATGSNYTVQNASAADAGTYTVTVTNLLGSATSDAAVVTVSPPVAPAIAEQPQGQTVAFGQTLQLSVIASGSLPLAYQWYLGGAAIPQATSATLSVPQATSATAGSYTVTISNSQGTVTSAAAAVAVGSDIAPTFSSQPQSLTVADGGMAQFTAVVAGSPTLTYQWYLNTVAVSGATSATLTIEQATAANAGNYTVVASNAAGSATSAAAALTVSAPTAPVITVQPGSQVLVPGLTLFLTPGFTGSPPLTYQWYFNGVALPGATYGNLSIFGFSAANAGSYTVTVSNSAGTATSTPAMVSVGSVASATPVFASSPQGETVAAGAPLSLSATVLCTAFYTLQWQLNGTAIPGATGASYYIPTAASSDAGTYTCVCNAGSGLVTSAPAEVTVLAPVAPVILQQPAGESLDPGDPLQLSVVENASPTPTFQWQLGGVAIPNATGETYSVSRVNASNAGNYTVVVTNSAGSVTSTPAVVTVAAATPPVITGQPQSVTYYPAGTVGYVTFAVYATGPDLSYQWSLNGQALPEQTSPIYEVSGPTAAQAGSYTVTVSNPAGSVTSEAAVLTVAPPVTPTILLEPDSRILQSGIYTSIGVSATEGGPTGGIDSYQWYLNGVAIAGATGADYSFVGASASDDGTYTVTVSNSAGSVTSTGAQIQVEGPPTITTQPQNAMVDANGSATFTVAATSTAPMDFQWYDNGVQMNDGSGVVGSATATLSLSSLAPAESGTYVCKVSNFAGTTSSQGAVLGVQVPATACRLVNISVLTEEGPGENLVTMGFVSASGAPGGTQPLLLRVSGPALAQFNVSGFLADPELLLFDANSTEIGSNRGWADTFANQQAVGSMQEQVGAFPFTDPNSDDSALATTLASGRYSVEAASRSGGSGKVLAEVYDATANFTYGVTPRLINVSCQQNLAAGETMTMGFTLGGSSPRAVLIRADGPSLAAFGVSNVMADPVLSLYQGQTLMQSNAGWVGGSAIAQAAQTVGAFPLASASSLDSALLVFLPAGQYTAEVTSASGGGGAALVEVYEVP